ncbi:GNAT family N-acetyltransferase [Cohnella thailandensis]|uniref:GNAT family N-acetyltransferase n=1 Tax=Cohnella thailandensis TaxID=557557 RepID=A0A841SYH7_9BACL|nr:GNAT family N-acetyltransferase [Cohnella thailandensis]MBB6637273.1 GNAT family N-acetyltransferase [Cohnella thailandensis]MBP1976601.1 GNAT superfamily N-acetyltransferase [Cohnella thailandensis]
MRFQTLSLPDNELWPAALELYHEAFPDVKGRKPDRIIEGMFGEGQGLLHALIDEESGGVQAIAFAAVLSGAKVLLIDYLAVRIASRGQGLGRKLVEEIKREAARRHLDGLLIEVEAEETEENRARIRFWQACGFESTDYVHKYIWVPEPYRAMTLSLDPDRPLPEDGKRLFKWITGFHERAFRKR